MHIIVCSGCAMLSHWPSRRLSRANIDSPQCRASRAASHDGRRPARCPCRQVPFMCQHGGRVYFREKMEQSAGRAIDTSAGASNACGWSLALWFLRSSRMREFHICWRPLLTKQHNGEHCHEPSGVTNQLGPIAPTQ